jgi:hypothetical protein
MKIDSSPAGGGGNVPRATSFSGYIRMLNTNIPVKDVRVIAKRCNGEIVQGKNKTLLDYCTGEIVEYARVYTNSNGYYETPSNPTAWSMDYEKDNYWKVSMVYGPNNTSYLGSFARIRIRYIDTIPNLDPPYNIMYVKVYDSLGLFRDTQYQSWPGPVIPFFSDGRPGAGDFTMEGNCAGDMVNKVVFNYAAGAWQPGEKIFYVFCPANETTVVTFVRPPSKNK